MLSPIWASTTGSMSGNSVGSGRVVGSLDQYTTVSPQAAGASTFGSVMGFNLKTPWMQSAPNSDTSYTLAQSAAVGNHSNSTLPFGKSMSHNMGDQLEGHGKYFDFSGAWGATGAWGVGNFNSTGASQHFTDS
jgi:hypothetical protein